MMQRSWLVILVVLLMGCSESSLPDANKAAGNVAADTELARQTVAKAAPLLDAGQDQPARELLEKALAADPLYGPAHNDLGMIEFRQKRYYEAALHFRNAIKLLPRQPQPINNLGLVMERTGKLVAAEQNFSQAVGLDPENLQYIGNLARTRIALGVRDDPTQQLLIKIVLRDSRNDWVDWARGELRRFNAATRPALGVNPGRSVQ